MALYLGRLADNNLQCPYHGWQFAPGTGACAAVPSLPDRRPPPHGDLKVYPCAEALGHVWAALDTPDLPLPAQPEADNPEWVFAYGTDMTCGLRQVTENFRPAARGNGGAPEDSSSRARTMLRRNRHVWHEGHQCHTKCQQA